MRRAEPGWGARAQGDGDGPGQHEWHLAEPRAAAAAHRHGRAPGGPFALAGGLTLRLVGLDPTAFPSPIQRGAALLPAAQSLGDARDEFTLDAEAAAIAQGHQQLLARARCNVHNGRTWLQARRLDAWAEGSNPAMTSSLVTH